jgi:hypothetical protein
MRRTFLRCSLRRQQPSPGSRRFDDLCDPSHCHGFIGPSDSFALDYKASPGNSVVSIRAPTPGRERALPSKRAFRGPSSEEPEQRFFGVPARAASADQAVLLFRGCPLACQDEATGARPLKVDQQMAHQITRKVVALRGISWAETGRRPWGETRVQKFRHDEQTLAMVGAAGIEPATSPV